MENVFGSRPESALFVGNDVSAVALFVVCVVTWPGGDRHVESSHRDLPVFSSSSSSMTMLNLDLVANIHSFPSVVAAVDDAANNVGSTDPMSEITVD